MRDPGVSPDARANVVTFNGELYNFRELRAELAKLGFAARSGSDTEVLLHAYRAWGARAAERFEGMFAFCLVDPERGIAWFCRDGVGIKPLYVYEASGSLLFASEVRALLASGPEFVAPRLDAGALETYLAQGAVIGEESIVSGVRALDPGESLVTDFAGRRLRSTRYWSATFGRGSGAERRAADGSEAAIGEGQAAHAKLVDRSLLVGELAAALRESVRGQLLADVPVGLFLSAGIDSTALAVLANEVSTQPLRTLAVGFDVPGFDETDDAELTARELGTVHQRIQITGTDIRASLEDVLAATDQPTVDGFNTYCISRAAHAAGLTVALSGVGGDELFGGYRTFKDVPRALMLRRAVDKLGPETLSHVSASLESLAGTRALAQHGRGLRKLSRLLEQPPNLTASYLLRRELFTAAERRALQALPSGLDAQTGLRVQGLSALGVTTQGADPLDSVAALEFSVYLRHMLLRDADVFSMANRLEIRVPLLDQRVVALAARAPGAWRRADPRPKPLLVDAVGQRLPSRVWRAKKRGFTLPWHAWLRGPLRERAASAMHANLWREAGLDARAVRELWGAFLAGDGRVSALEVLALVVLESYLRRHALTH
jgi:asparagine synthase (glutamine-hydrolysing)